MASAVGVTEAVGTARNGLPGLAAAAVVGIAAAFLSEHYGGPTMLYALLLGMAFNFLSEEGRCVPGIALASRSVLRFGVALLGMRITFDQVAGLGGEVPLLMVGAVAFTILSGLLLARLMGLSPAFGVLTGVAVAVCGASAALAVAAVLPRHADEERDAGFTVIGVTTLSTLAMILYPMAVKAFGLNPTDAGLFLGGTIHDVAQVVGAGYGMSTETGDTATIAKLLRVALLLPVVMAVSLAFRGKARTGERPPLLPPFLIGFALLVTINSLGVIPREIGGMVNDLSRWCLVTAIAALGMKTSLKSMVTLGARPVLLLTTETLLMAGLVMGVLLIR